MGKHGAVDKFAGDDKRHSSARIKNPCVSVLAGVQRRQVDQLPKTVVVLVRLKILSCIVIPVVRYVLRNDVYADYPLPICSFYH